MTSTQVSTFGRMARDKNPRNNILAEDTFKNGTCGFVQLIGSQYPSGVVMHDDEYGYGDGGSMVMETADCAQDGSDNAWATATAVKRLWRPSSAHIGIIEMELVWAFGSQYDANSPRHVVFGLDCCSPSAERRFFQFRWLNYDSTIPSRVTKYQLMNNAGTWVDLPTATWQASAGAEDIATTAIPHGWNENKRDWHHLRMKFDVANSCYDGFSIDGDPFGSYTGNATDTAAIRAYGPQHQTLPTFENGFNTYIAIGNKSNTPTNTHSWLNVGYHRVEV